VTDNDYKKLIKEGIEYMQNCPAQSQTWIDAEGMPIYKSIKQLISDLCDEI